MNNEGLYAFVCQLIHCFANLWSLLWTQISRVHSSVVRAADCRSAGPCFKSGRRSWFTFVTGSGNLTNQNVQRSDSMSPITRKSVKIFSLFPFSSFPFFFKKKKLFFYFFPFLYLSLLYFFTSLLLTSLLLYFLIFHIFSFFYKNFFQKCSYYLTVLCSFFLSCSLFHYFSLLCCVFFFIF